MERPVSIKELIEKELEREDLSLPFPDSMAMQLNTMMNNDGMDIPTLARMIEKDPSLTAKILNLSNSAFYSGLEKTRTVERAIARVGLLGIRSFLTTVLMKEVFVGQGGSFKEFFDINWKHSLACAIACRSIAEKAKLKSLSEDAYLLGLIHDIGTMFILSLLVRLAKSGAQDVTGELAREILEAFHPAIGARILAKLNFDAKCCRIVETHHDIDQFEEQEDPLFNILQVANNLTRKVGISITPNRDVSIISLPSTARLGIEPLFIATLEIEIEDTLATMESLV